jgi:hypothetical protein
LRLRFITKKSQSLEKEFHLCKPAPHTLTDMLNRTNDALEIGPVHIFCSVSLAWSSKNSISMTVLVKELVTVETLG